MAEDHTHHSVTGGRWLYGLTFQHPTDTDQYKAETATVAADHWRGHGLRKPTETEMESINELNYERPTAGESHFVRFSYSGGIHERDVIIGPDDLAPRPGGILYWWHPSCRPAERGDTGAGD